MGKAAGKQGTGTYRQADPTWSGLRFCPRPAPMARWHWRRHLPLALASLAAHGLLIASLLHAHGPRPASGNALLETDRVQLRFVSVDDVVREKGAAAASVAAVSPTQAPASTATATSISTSTAAPLPVSRARPPVAVASLPAVAGQAGASPAGPAVEAVASTAAAAAAQAEEMAASHGAAGHGQAARGHGRAAHSSAPAQDRQGVADWSQEVMRRLARFRSYPAAARAERIEGVVMVQATIAADGQVLATRVRHSCGNADLDAEALATFGRARRLPAPPAHLPSPLQVDLPVAFTLHS